MYVCRRASRPGKGGCEREADLRTPCWTDGIELQLATCHIVFVAEISINGIQLASQQMARLARFRATLFCA